MKSKSAIRKFQDIGYQICCWCDTIISYTKDKKDEITGETIFTTHVIFKAGEYVVANKYPDGTVTPCRIYPNLNDAIQQHLKENDND